MVNKTALQECERLERVYKQRWGRKVDLSLLPRAITQELVLHNRVTFCLFQWYL